jgi:hypothetical protein
MGHHRIHFQLHNPPKALLLVDAVQLYPLHCIGLQSDSMHDCHLPHIATPQGWDYFELVGKYSLEEYSRCEWDAILYFGKWGNLWT